MSCPNSKKQSPGYVYVLSNASMPGLLKIGRSINGGKSRAKNIYQTGVPAPFVLEFEILVDCAVTVEALVHEKLSGFRLSDSREFFRVDPMTAKHAIIECDLREDDYTLCSIDEYAAVEGAAYVASKSGTVWLDACNMIGWLEPEDFERAEQRRAVVAQNPLIGMRVN